MGHYTGRPQVGQIAAQSGYSNSLGLAHIGKSHNVGLSKVHYSE